MNTGFCFELRVQDFQPPFGLVQIIAKQNGVVRADIDAARQLAFIDAVGAAGAFLRDIQIVVLVDNIIRAGRLTLAASRA